MMRSKLSKRWVKVLCGMAVGAGVAVGAGQFVSVPQARAADSGGSGGGRVAELTKLGLKFDGAQTCAASGCHNEAANKPAPGPFQTEQKTWSDKDQHSQAYAHLKKPLESTEDKHPEYKDIGKNLGIKKPQTSDRCLTCHAMKVPDEVQGQNFEISEGVSCDSCHGPSEKWTKPHSAAGWTNGERAKLASATGGDWKGQEAHDKLLKTWGLYDTKPLVARAEICVSCHLAIDAELVEKGKHPQPFFELNFFQATEPRHWREKPDLAGINHIKVWAVGQIVSLQAAADQVAARAGGAGVDTSVNQALAHFESVKALADAGAFALPPALATAAGGLKADPAKNAAPFKDAVKLLANGALDLKPDAALAGKIAKAVQADAAYGNLGREGAQQQSLAIWSMVTAVAPVGDPNQSGDADAVLKATPKDLVDLIKAAGVTQDSDYDAAAYKAALGKVKLP